ncbi:hypothetical protein [Petrachloros mirabilis]
MIERISVKLSCGKCGSRITWDEAIIDEEILTCANCGEILGRYGDIKDEAARQAASKIERDLKKLFDLR